LVVLCIDYSNSRVINRTILSLDHSFQHFSSFPWTRPSYQQRYQRLRPTLKQWRTFHGLRVLISFPRFTFISSAVHINCLIVLQGAFVLFFGKVLAMCAAKPVFMVSIAIFELGSLFCAVAPSVDFLIFGRARRWWSLGFHFVHLGTGDPLFSHLSCYFDAFVYVCHKVKTVSQRSALMGIFRAIFAISSIGGPLPGGLFAGMPPFLSIVLRLHILKDKSSWRWVKLPSGLTRLDMPGFVWLPRTVGVSVEFIFWIGNISSSDRYKPSGSWIQCSLSSTFHYTALDRWYSTRRNLLGNTLCSRTCRKWGVNTT